ncbi:MAG: HEPN domain-containing protein [Gemmatimonadota bacterium]
MKEASAKFLDKAARSIRAARRLLDGGDVEFAVGRAYYAMFYVAEALLTERGLRFRKHGGVHGAFGEHFVKAGELDPKYHRWLLEAFNKRITADYGVDAVATRQDAEGLLAQADEFLREARRYLGAP